MCEAAKYVNRNCLFRMCGHGSINKNSKYGKAIDQFDVLKYFTMELCVFL